MLAEPHPDIHVVEAPVQTCPTKNPRNFESVADVAARYRVTTRTVRRWIAEGRLTAYRVGPTLIRLDVAEVDRLLSPIPTAGGAA